MIPDWREKIFYRKLKITKPMPIISLADLATNIYAETITEITRADDSLPASAINAAIQEAKMYLSRFDLLQLFGDDSTAPAIADEYLKSLVKDLACWHLLRVANVSADADKYRRAYDDALKALKSIMEGQAQPAGWPYANVGETDLPKGDTVSWTSNPRRHSHY